MNTKAAAGAWRLPLASQAIQSLKLELPGGTLSSTFWVKEAHKVEWPEGEATPEPPMQYLPPLTSVLYQIHAQFAFRKDYLPGSSRSCVPSSGDLQLVTICPSCKNWVRYANKIT